MLRTCSVLMTLLVGSPVFAQAIYRWVDAEGTTHYTDNPASIPQGATVFATEGDPISEMGKPGPVPVPVHRVAAVEQPRVDSDPAVPTTSEVYWRGQFRAAKEKISALEEEIAADRHRVEDVNGLPAAISYSCIPPYYGVAPPVGHGNSVVGVHGGGVFPNFFNTCIQTINPDYERARLRIEKNRKALERAKEELHELERRASFEAVPLQWRR